MATTFNNDGINDWALRITAGDRIVVVDSTLENLSGQGTLRNGGTGNPIENLWFYRSRSINGATGSSITNLSNIGTAWIVQQSEIHVRNVSGAGVYSPFSSRLHFVDVDWFSRNTVNSNPNPGPIITDASLASSEPSTGQFRQGEPTYNDYVEHPGYTATTSPNTGITMAVVNPFDL